MVLINIIDSYELPAELVSSMSDISLHVIVIKRSDGKAILNLLHHKPGERVLAQLLAESRVDALDVERLYTYGNQSSNGRYKIIAIT